MERRIGIGALAGLIAGIVFTVVALFLKTTMPDGEQTSMLVVAAETIHAHGWLAGWIASLVYTVGIGAIFGWLAATKTPSESQSMVFGALYGVAWWIVSGLIVIPALLERVPLSSEAVDAMRPLALASLVEHLLYGVILGFVFPLLVMYLDRRHGAQAQHHAA